MRVFGDLSFLCQALKFGVEGSKFLILLLETELVLTGIVDAIRVTVCAFFHRMRVLGLGGRQDSRAVGILLSR